MEVRIDEKALSQDVGPARFQVALDYHKSVCELLGRWFNADIVSYICRHKGESYIIEKGGKTLELAASGNGFDGGWMSVKERLG